MTNIVPTRRDESNAPRGDMSGGARPHAAMPQSLPILARLPRIEFQAVPNAMPANQSAAAAAAMGSQFTGQRDNASGEQHTSHEQAANPPHDQVSLPSSEFSAPIGQAGVSGIEMPAASPIAAPPAAMTYRIDHAHHAASQPAPQPGTQPASSYATSQEASSHTPSHETQQEDNAERRRDSERSLWPRHRMVRKGALMSAAVAVVLTPLFFLLGDSEPTQPPQTDTSAWPERSLRDESGTGQQQPLLDSPRMADRPTGRPFAPSFPPLKEAQPGAGQVPSDQNKSGPSAETPETKLPSGPSKAPQVRLGKNIHTVPGDADERDRSSIY